MVKTNMNSKVQENLKKNLPSVSNSIKTLSEARKIMYPPTQTLAKGPTQFVEGISPVFADAGKMVIYLILIKMNT